MANKTIQILRNGTLYTSSGTTSAHDVALNGLKQQLSLGLPGEPVMARYDGGNGQERVIFGLVSSSGKYEIFDLTEDITVADIEALPVPSGELDPDNWEYEISRKEDKATIVNVPNGTIMLSPRVNSYYNFNGTVETLTIVLPVIYDTSVLSSLILYFTTGFTPNVTITASDGSPVAYFEGYGISANMTYEINCMYNSSKWIISYGIIS